MAWACRFRAGEADTNRSLKLTVRVASYIFPFFRAVRDPVQNQKHIEKTNKPTSPHPRPPNPQNQTKAWMMSKECQPKLSSGFHNHTCACVLTHTCVTSYIWSHTHTHSTHTHSLLAIGITTILWLKVKLKGMSRICLGCEERQFSLLYLGMLETNITGKNSLDVQCSEKVWCCADHNKMICQ